MNSLWLNKKTKDNFPKLEKNLETDVCIIGGGIFGISTAYYLSQNGYNVVILERDRIANKVTGHTTAKITSQHGLIYHYLLNQYGKEFARKYYLANQKSIQQIEKIITQNQIECDFERQNSCVYTINQSEMEKIDEELQALKELLYRKQYCKSKICCTCKPLSIYKFSWSILCKDVSEFFLCYWNRYKIRTF